MFRTTDIVLIAVMVSAAAFTYQTKHDAENEMEKLRSIEAKIRYEDDTLDVLKADWSLLTQPSRLQRLVDIYQDELDLAPVEAEQIADLSELPPRVLRIEDLTGEQSGAVAEADSGQIVTGGITQ